MKKTLINILIYLSIKYKNNKKINNYIYKEIYKDIYSFNYFLNIYIKKNNYKIVELLINYNNKYKKFNILSNSIYFATVTGNLDLVKLLILNGVLPWIDDDVAIIKASQYGYTHIVEYLLSFDSVSPEEDNNMALMIALQKNYKDIALLLFKNDKVINLLKTNNKKLYIELKRKYIFDKIKDF